jgi:hypothetical protein
MRSQLGGEPGLYRDTAYLHGALAAGATWDEIAAATGADQAGARRRYREWADDRRTSEPVWAVAWRMTSTRAAIKWADGKD